MAQQPIEHVHRPVERQVVGAGRLVRPARVQRDARAGAVDDGRAAGAAGGVGARPRIEGVLVLVVRVVVLRAVAVDPRDRGREDLNLLRVVVADHQDLCADAQSRRRQRNLRGRREAQGGRVELEDPEVVYRIAVDWPHRELLVLVEGGEGADRAGRDDVPVRQDQRLLRVRQAHDEAGALPDARGAVLEGPHAGDADRNDGALHLVDGGRPLGSRHHLAHGHRLGRPVVLLRCRRQCCLPWLFGPGLLERRPGRLFLIDPRTTLHGRPTALTSLNAY
mmetsp:Transcript_100345/g.318618  ORF Transcript_100345/g.318618 Transcript_100345/m.318618 type:complete len:278 (+) Transcript_100345:2618-3451(+)